MKTINKILTYIVIVCVLIMSTMGIISASSWSSSGSFDDGHVMYYPYIPLDYLRITDIGNQQFFTIRLNNVFESYNTDNIVGLDYELLCDVESSLGNLTVPIRLSNIQTSNQNFILKMQLPVSSLNGFSSSDGMILDISAHDVLVNSSRTTAEWLPNIILTKFSEDSTFPTFSMNYNAKVVHFTEGVNENKFETAESLFSKSWNNLNSSEGRTNIFRLSNIKDSINRYANENYYWYGGQFNDILLIDEYNVSLSTDGNVQFIEMYVPYTNSIGHHFEEYVNGFDLDREIIQTSIVTSIVEVTPDYETQYTSFTDWLIVAVGGFMDFGFWGISIGAILGTIILFKLIKALLDYFSGG